MSIKMGKIRCFFLVSFIIFYGNRTLRRQFLLTPER
uniref:Uncharacterized protein n=1 Tax=Manihot esculenta TaxID=3983 RepID=A0A2C9VYD5_MANES